MVYEIFIRIASNAGALTIEPVVHQLPRMPALH